MRAIDLDWTDPEMHKQNGESLSQLSDDEILAVQEMRRKAA